MTDAPAKRKPTGIINAFAESRWSEDGVPVRCGLCANWRKGQRGWGTCSVGWSAKRRAGIEGKPGKPGYFTGVVVIDTYQNDGCNSFEPMRGWFGKGGCNDDG